MEIKERNYSYTVKNYIPQNGPVSVKNYTNLFIPEILLKPAYTADTYSVPREHPANVLSSLNLNKVT
jgi:hypothetical protein